MAQNYVEILVKARDDAKPDLDRLRERLQELGREVETARAQVDDTQAAATLDRLQAKLDLLKRKTKIDIEAIGALKAEAEIHAVEASLDRLKKKADEAGPKGLLGKMLFGDGGKDSGGLLGSFGSLPGGAGLGELATNPYGLAALGAGITALLPELLGLASGFAAAGAGAASFYVLAKPAVTTLTQNFQQFHQAVINYTDASQNLDTAINSNKSNMAAYQATIHGVSPDLAAAAKLLTDQNVQWQNLTPSMQNALVALSNNKAELKAMLPDQKEALKQLLAQGDALGNLDPAGQKAVGLLQSLTMEFNRIQKAFEPSAFKLFNAGLTVLNNLLPLVTPFATTFANAMSSLLGSLNNSLFGAQIDRVSRGVHGLVGSIATVGPTSGFKQFLDQFHALEGPALTAIGKGLGQVIVQLAKLLTVMSAKDVVNSINIAFTILSGTIDGLRHVVEAIMRAWDVTSKTMARDARQVATAFDALRHDLAVFGDDVLHIIDRVAAWWASLPRRMMAAANWHTVLYAAGQSVVQGFINGIGSMFGAVAGAAVHMVESLGSKVLHVLGIGSPSKVAHWWGQMVAQGMAEGIADGARLPADAAARMAAGVSGGLGAAGGGGAGGGVLRVQLELAGGDSQFMTALAGAIRVRGGDPRILNKKVAFQ